MMTQECVLSDQEVRRPKREPQTGGAAGGGKGGEVGWGMLMRRQAGGSREARATWGPT